MAVDQAAGLGPAATGKPVEREAVERLRADEAALDRQLAQARQEAARVVAFAREEAARGVAEARAAAVAEAQALEEAAQREVAHAAEEAEARVGGLDGLRARAARNTPRVRAWLLALVAGKAEP